MRRSYTDYNGHIALGCQNVRQNHNVSLNFQVDCSDTLIFITLIIFFCLQISFWMQYYFWKQMCQYKWIQRLFFVSLQWTAVLIGATTVISVVGVIVFLLYRRYKLSSQCRSFSFVSTMISCSNTLHILYINSIFSFRAIRIITLIVSVFRFTLISFMS